MSIRIDTEINENISDIKTRKVYTKAEKLEILELTLGEGQSIKELPKIFTDSENTVYN